MFRETERMASSINALSWLTKTPTFEMSFDRCPEINFASSIEMARELFS